MSDRGPALAPVPRGPTRFPPRARAPCSRAGSGRVGAHGVAAADNVGFYVPELCGILQAGGGVGSASLLKDPDGGSDLARCGGWGCKVGPGPSTWAGFGRWCEGEDTPPCWGLPLCRAGWVPRPGWLSVGREGVTSEVRELEVGRKRRRESRLGRPFFSVVFSWMVWKSRKFSSPRSSPARA